jgi:hypothetical protein
MMRNFILAFFCLILSTLFFGKYSNILLLNYQIESLIEKPIFLLSIFALFGINFLINGLKARRNSTLENIDITKKVDEIKISKIENNIKEDNSNILNFLIMLQEKARVLDFIKDDISVYSDEDVGRVARVVHQGLKEVINSNMSIKPIHSGDEGEIVNFSDSVDYIRHKFLGIGTKKPPFQGTIIHKGWEATKISIPKINSQNLVQGSSIIQQVEIEVK